MFVHRFATSFAETVPHVVDLGSLFQHVLHIIGHTLKRPMEAAVIKSVPAVNFSSYRSLSSWHDVRVNEYSTLMVADARYGFTAITEECPVSQEDIQGVIISGRKRH